MLESIKESDFAKFIIMLLVYTIGIAWWAASLTTKVNENTEHIMDIRSTLTSHILTNAVESTKIAISDNTIQNIQKNQEKIQELMKDNIASHAKCAAIIEGMLKRMENIEEGIYKRSKN